jgi:uncharacterized membrane protein
MVRTMIVLLLGAAAFDLPIPGRSRDRIRIHLIDRSASTAVPGPAESLLPRDADDIVARDVASRSGGDAVGWASFGRTTAFESRTVDGTATDLAGALATALGRNPTEIILYTDGRADPGTALFLCRERGVPVYLFPLGPTTVQDARIVRVDAPADALPQTPVPIAVVVESTVDLKTRLKVGSEARDIALVAGIPARFSFTLPEPGPFRVDLEAKDACDENNHASGEVFRRSDRTKVLALSLSFPSLPEFDVTVAATAPRLLDFDVVIVDNIALSPADQQALSAWVLGGGGLLLLGGPKSYALGGWKATPLADLSPLKVAPDLRIAAVLGLDASGSMSEDFEEAAQVLLDARSGFDADDDLTAMTFGDDARILDFAQLRKVRPTGGTSIVKGIETARLHLESRSAGRKVVVLMTDGETKETPEEIRAAVDRLKDIGLLVITTKKDVPGAKNVPLRDWKELRRVLRSVTDGIQDLFRESPGAIEFRSHPVTEGVLPVAPAGINRTTAKPGSQIVATAGSPPAQDPVVAFAPAGQGRVGAFTIPYDPALARLFRQAIEYVAGEAAGGLRLSVDPPLVRARGSGPPRLQVETTAGPIFLDQVGQDSWEGRLPEGLSGTVLVRKGRARAAATIPCPPEFEKLGVDRAALERIARETGGRVLSLPSELSALRRPEESAPKSGRPLFLVAALVLVFVEMAVSTFWKV